MKGENMSIINETCQRLREERDEAREELEALKSAIRHVPIYAGFYELPGDDGPRVQQIMKARDVRYLIAAGGVSAVHTDERRGKDD